VTLLLSKDVAQANPESGRRAPGRFRPLDGLRGLAVLAVFLYHAGVKATPGGLLGVDVFFVLSGYLITGLLLTERDRSGGISLRAFWTRRVRRLLPASVIVVVTTVVLWQATADPGQLPSLRRDALATLGYAANWRFVLSGQSYFQHYAPPSPLLHMWSLGVEEQFYLVWPVLLLLLLRYRSYRRARLTTAVTSLVLLATASGWCALLAFHGADPSRMYYGSDTRAPALLVGAVTACLAWHTRPPATRSGRHRRRRYPMADLLVGLLGTAGLIWAVLEADGQSAFFYRGGFLLVAVATAAVVVSVVRAPTAPLAQLFSLTPLVALGRISYGVYLWHWPAILFLTSARTGVNGAALLVLRAAATLTLAAASWTLIERPVLLGRIRVPRAPFVIPATVAALAVAVIALPLPQGSATAVAPDFAAISRQDSTPPPPKPNGGPTSSRPTRVLLVGDSVALTLGQGVTTAAKEQGVVLVDRGVLGCGVVTGGPIRDRGTVSAGPPGCDQAVPGWLTQTRLVQPDVVAVMVGRWETYDRYYQGQFRAPGDPVFDAHLLQLLDSSIDQLLARGSKVALLTPICSRAHENPDGTPATEDDPARRIRFAQLLQDAVSRHPGGQVALFDVNSQLCPNDQYQRTDAAGTVLRTSDGIHVTPYGGIGVGRWLVPQLVSFAKAGRPQ
jgi:peptidoglycan/LPS O-acetylase OafA/YrhL